MKKLLVLFLFSLCSISAKADVIYCAVQGDVLLQVQSETVHGYICNQEVSLTRYQNMLYGDIAGLETSLRFYGRYVVGTIGSDDIHWSFNKGGFITGSQKCIYDIIRG